MPLGIPSVHGVAIPPWCPYPSWAAGREQEPPWVCNDSNRHNSRRPRLTLVSNLEVLRQVDVHQRRVDLQTLFQRPQALVADPPQGPEGQTRQGLVCREKLRQGFATRVAAAAARRLCRGAAAFFWLSLIWLQGIVRQVDLREEDGTALSPYLCMCVAEKLVECQDQHHHHCHEHVLPIGEQ